MVPLALPPRAAGPVAGSGATARGAGAGLAGAAGIGAAVAVAEAAVPSSSAGVPGPTRLDRPKRCTLPITALRVTPPNSLAIWLADWPSAHIFLSVSTRSSVQDMGKTPQ